MEDSLLKIMESINRHHEEEAQVKESLYRTRQKVEALNLAIMIKKSHYSLEQNDEALKDIESIKVQLKQLLINEDSIIHRMKELRVSKEQLQESIKRNIMLADKWIFLLSEQMDHESDIVQQIPTDNDVIPSDSEELMQIQKQDIQKLKEELEIKDKLIEQAENRIPRELLTYEAILQSAAEEQARAPFKQRQGERLFTKVTRFGMVKTGCRQADIQKKSDRDKRNYSVVSQNSSFSTGNSSGAGALGKLANSLVKDPSRSSVTNPHKSSHRQLLNAGTRIVIGPTKTLLNTEKLPFMATSDTRESRQGKVKIEKIRGSRFVIERPQILYGNKSLYH
eukprot:TRINITY_DN6014_c0_g2_i12.p1 TRINITY_DN6014_c0_g2~~TRINITY_DN6014_c0_g2_i12.p1  ORF type:complete len:337 (-),score=89.82 TRINITY_DN6014_c0_g2_i12:143-1153(-)